MATLPGSGIMVSVEPPYLPSGARLAAAETTLPPVPLAGQEFPMQSPPVLLVAMLSLIEKLERETAMAPESSVEVFPYIVLPVTVNEPPSVSSMAPAPEEPKLL